MRDTLRVNPWRRHSTHLQGAKQRPHRTVSIFPGGRSRCAAAMRGFPWQVVPQRLWLSRFPMNCHLTEPKIDRRLLRPPTRLSTGRRARRVPCRGRNSLPMISWPRMTIFPVQTSRKLWRRAPSLGPRHTKSPHKNVPRPRSQRLRDHQCSLPLRLTKLCSPA